MIRFVYNRRAMTSVQLEHHDGVCLLKVSRAPVNAIDLPLALELAGAVERAVAGGDRALVIAGAAGVFSAGLDLKRVPTYGPEDQRAMIRAVNRLVAGLYACPLPVVAAITGHAIGGGLIVALCADYRVCTTAPCQLALTEIRAGVAFPAAPMAVLRGELDPSVTRVLTLRATPLDPQRALAMRLVDELQPAEEVVARALAVADELGRLPASAYGQVKYQLRAEAIAKARAAADSDGDPLLAAWLGPDAASASAAVLKPQT